VRYLLVLPLLLMGCEREHTGDFAGEGITVERVIEDDEPIFRIKDDSEDEDAIFTITFGSDETNTAANIFNIESCVCVAGDENAYGFKTAEEVNEYGVLETRPYLMEFKEGTSE